MKPRFAHILLMVVSILGCNSGVAQPRPVDMVPTDSAIESPRTKTTSKPAPADLVNPHNEQVDNALVDPSGDALSAFHAALNRAETGQGQARIAFFGASHTAADLWSGHVRRLLQQRFGDAGHGYMMPVRWHGGFRHQDVNMSSSKGWKVHRHKRLDPVPVGDYGFGGVAVSSDDPKQWIEVATCVDNPQGKRADRLEIWYRAGPRGGTIRLRLDNRSIELDTRSKRTQLRFARYDLVDGGHSLRIEPGGDGEVYLYGVVIERTKPGVLIDQMGIPGMRGNIILHWQETPWRAQMARRSPDLVILAYGVNSVAEKNEAMWRFRENWRRVLERVRTAAPKAACMIIGPTDWPLKPDETGTRNHRPRIDAVIAAQKRVAAEYGCAFWDAFAAMGGAGSMVRWVANGLAGRDHVHLTRSGYELLADRLTRDLLNGYSVVSR